MISAMKVPDAPHTPVAIGRRLADAAIMLAVSLLSVWLLIYVAYGTTKRTYEQLLIDKAAAQGELVRNPIENYLRPGLPLRQFTAFKQLTSSIIDGDNTLVSMLIELADGELVFSAGDASIRTLARAGERLSIHNDGEVRRSDGVAQIILPLRNKFERVGTLVVTMDRAAIQRQLQQQFYGTALVALVACFAFGFIVFRAMANVGGLRQRTIVLAFSGCFAAVAVAVILSMISLFTAGAEVKGRALTSSLGQRLDDIPQLGLQLEQIQGLDLVLDSYRQLNPEISSIAITVNGRINVHTDRSRLGNLWSIDPEQSEYRAQLTPPNHPRATQVILSVPRNYVFWQVVRNVKNYGALFVASSLFAFLFLQVAQSLHAARAAPRGGEADWRSALALELVKPVYFVAVFVDHLSYAFLPQFVSGLAQSSGETSASAAWPFTAYYLCFALSLIPAGHHSNRFGPRNLVIGGLALVTAGLIAMTLVQTLGGTILARALAGTGQGILFIGVQNFILTQSVRERRTRANGIIVYGYQGGLISGMAIGSLLVGEIGPIGVFTVAAFIAAAIALYAFILLPADAPREQSASGAKSDGALAWLETLRLLRDPGFASTILLVGIPAKAVLTGVILFGLPLLLTAMGFAKEDIGQITMIYAACVIVASWIAGHVADRVEKCRTLLAAGTILTALGLLVIAAAGQDAIAASPNALVFKTLLLVAGAAIIGFAHGLINAPVVTYITDTAIAGRIGEATVASGYRFLERCGHMLGPMIVGQLFLVAGTSPVALIWLAFALVVLGLLFHMLNFTDPTLEKKEEFA